MTPAGTGRAGTWDAALVADDLTGAGDSAVRFADGGWRTVLAVGAGAASSPAPVERPSLLALSADVRAAAPGTAREVLRQRFRALLAAGVPRLYLKVDSTLRGSVAAQVAGALDLWTDVRPDGFAVVCPAYPAMGRTVEQGRALVDGVPLERAAAGADPVTPVLTSVLAELLPGSRRVVVDEEDAPVGDADGEPVDADGAALARSLLAAADGGARVLTVDAADDAALERVARAVARCGDRALPVGSAGLADPMARLWWPAGAARAPRRRVEEAREGPLLVLVTSLHPVAREQVERLAGRAGTVVVRHPDADGDEAVEVPPEALAADVVVLAPQRPGHGGPSRDAAAVATSAAAALDRLHRRLGASAVVAVGGDGAAALLERWGATGLDVHGALAAGVPAGALVGGRAAGLAFASKAGGFGGPSTLLDVVDRLAGARRPRAAPR
ncbi:four-carbon acid sugar kinase family protein [Pseudokineococcus basanitobsidens]|uniref:Four-carbon acid sugar kinase family protein n=1 Tax=Pseudokineococcus basanitobsidens TaxID=1926649 RepID=A0ABU8RK67_9ACTN